MDKKSAIILAGGAGKRMRSSIAKQFLLLQNKPIIFHTIERFYNYDNTMQIIVVLPQNQLDYWHKMIEKYKLNIPVEITFGGKERFHSAQKGFEKVKHRKVVVHDAVRPLISMRLLNEGFEALKNHSVAIPVLLPKDSYRIIDNEDSHPIDRSKLRIVQTPQFFVYEALQKTLSLPYSTNFTDEASAAQKAGYNVYLFQGEEKNIKITTPSDLEIAEIFIKGLALK